MGGRVLVAAGSDWTEQVMMTLKSKPNLVKTGVRHWHEFYDLTVLALSLHGYYEHDFVEPSASTHFTLDVER